MAFWLGFGVSKGRLVVLIWIGVVYGWDAIGFGLVQGWLKVV